jgi:hypothetical protein
MTTTKAKREPDEKIMNEAREESMKKFGDLYAEPPPYSSQPSSARTSTSNSAPTARIPRIEQLSFTPSPLEIPTPAECISHLKLLHAFAKLRHDVGNHEGLYGIYLEKADDVAQAPFQNGGQNGGEHETHEQLAAPEAASGPDTSLAERVRDKRWSVFVEKAVARFEAWWDVLPTTSSIWSVPIKTHNFETDSVLHDSKLSSVLEAAGLNGCSQKISN